MKLLLMFQAQEPPVNGQTPSEETEPAQTEQPEKEEEVEVVADDPRRPRLCHLIRAANGFGFNLHSDKSKKGRYIRTVDEGSPAETSGLRAGDRLIEVIKIFYLFLLLIAKSKVTLIVLVFLSHFFAMFLVRFL